MLVFSLTWILNNLFPFFLHEYSAVQKIRIVFLIQRYFKLSTEKLKQILDYTNVEVRIMEVHSRFRLWVEDSTAQAPSSSSDLGPNKRPNYGRYSDELAGLLRVLSAPSPSTLHQSPPHSISCILLNSIRWGLEQYLRLLSASFCRKYKSHWPCWSTE